MAKKNRGKGLWNLESRGRGTCPICKTTRVKVLYDTVTENGTVKVCKKCK
ncbi:hypothetical protein HYG86_15500 [Alkalicella caledoniensis]|uniref:Uncharacterized protein n=1 Tax=Alkalicella caledoniensis TaxID=2731377 RepID=A0A7G9WBL0_ALKCA|nr:hypothetical protein [Alkalicella caledoniensis]QNO16072.1 hypothetical protein HYG86_15500 [Alkalicella caledoniensis]